MTTAKCYCPDCPGSWAEKDAVDGSRFIRVCGCPCHEEHEEEEREAASVACHDDTCDCDSCCGDDVEYDPSEDHVPDCNCHDCIQ